MKKDLNFLVVDFVGNKVVDALIFDGENEFYTDTNGKASFASVSDTFKIVAPGLPTKQITTAETDITVKMDGVQGQLNEVEITAERSKKNSGFFLLVLLAILLSKR